MITIDAVYRDGVLQDGVRSNGAQLASGAFAWIGVEGLDEADLARLREAVGMAPEVLTEAYEQLPRPGLEVVGGYVIVALTTGPAEAEDVSVELADVLVVIGPDFVVTISDPALAGFVALRRELEAEPADLAGGPLAVFHAVLELVIDGYLVLIERVDREIRRVEREVFSSRGTNPVEQIYGLRRVMAVLDQAITPLVEEPLERLVRRRLPSWIGEDRYSTSVGEEALHEVDRHLRQIGGRVRTQRELLDGVLNANLTQVAIRQNEDMRKISAWVAMAAVPTMIAGIYGMNFEHMPELSWSYGYPIALSLMAALCALMHSRFRKNGWL